MRSIESRQLAERAPVETDRSWKPQNTRPWVHPWRRQLLLQLHQQLAAEWSEQMCEYLRKGDQFRFCSFGIESCGQCPELKGESACRSVFSFDGSALIGVIGLSEELARYLVDRQLGEASNRRPGEKPAAEKTDGDRQRPASFTRLESALLKKSLASLLHKAGTVYAAAGLGVPKAIDRAERVQARLGLLPDDPVIVFRYQVGEADSPLNLFIASTAALIDAVQEAPHPSQPGTHHAVLAATTAQLDVKLVLGNWNVTIEELSDLRIGDEIVLPNGADAWLAAGSIPVKRVRMKLSEDRIIVALKGGSHGAP